MPGAECPGLMRLAQFAPSVARRRGSQSVCPAPRRVHISVPPPLPPPFPGQVAGDGQSSTLQEADKVLSHQGPHGIQPGPLGPHHPVGEGLHLHRVAPAADWLVGVDAQRAAAVCQEAEVGMRADEDQRHGDLQHTALPRRRLQHTLLVRPEGQHPVAGEAEVARVRGGAGRARGRGRSLWGGAVLLLAHHLVHLRKKTSVSPAPTTRTGSLDWLSSPRVMAASSSQKEWQTKGSVSPSTSSRAGTSWVPVAKTTLRAQTENGMSCRRHDSSPSPPGCQVTAVTVVPQAKLWPSDFWETWGVARSGSYRHDNGDAWSNPKSLSGSSSESKSTATGLVERPSSPSHRYSRSWGSPQPGSNLNPGQTFLVHLNPGQRLRVRDCSSERNVLPTLILHHHHLHLHHLHPDYTNSTTRTTPPPPPPRLHHLHLHPDYITSTQTKPPAPTHRRANQELQEVVTSGGTPARFCNKARVNPIGLAGAPECSHAPFQPSHAPFEARQTLCHLRHAPADHALFQPGHAPVQVSQVRLQAGQRAVRGGGGGGGGGMAGRGLVGVSHGTPQRVHEGLQFTVLPAVLDRLHPQDLLQTLRTLLGFHTPSSVPSREPIRDQFLVRSARVRSFSWLLRTATENREKRWRSESSAPSHDHGSDRSLLLSPLQYAGMLGSKWGQRSSQSPRTRGRSQRTFRAARERSLTTSAPPLPSGGVGLGGELRMRYDHGGDPRGGLCWVSEGSGHRATTRTEL
ncbi:hypothetical protein CRUP_031324 [Coryphaenoides rupestris]|nr:hypothetical protein CRUP_031324 [Coryphaenoides rupestris]